MSIIAADDRFCGRSVMLDLVPRELAVGKPWSAPPPPPGALIPPQVFLHDLRVIWLELDFSILRIY